MPKNQELYKINQFIHNPHENYQRMFTIVFNHAVTT